MMTFIATVKKAMRPRGAPDERIGRLSSKSRNEISLDIHIVNEEQAKELRDVEDELALARKQLESAEEKEKFVGLRVESYRKALDEKANYLKPAERFEEETDEFLSSADNRKDLKDEDGEPKEESPTFSGTESERLQQFRKLEEQELSWNKAKTAHETLKHQVREFKKRVLVLQKKQNDIKTMQIENKDFVVAASAIPDDEEFANELNRLRVQEEDMPRTGDDAREQQATDSDTRSVRTAATSSR